jgi:hypothetical protein
MVFSIEFGISSLLLSPRHSISRFRLSVHCPSHLLPCSTSTTHGSRNEMIEEKEKKKEKNL